MTEESKPIPVTPLQQGFTQALHPGVKPPPTITSLHLLTPVLTSRMVLEAEAFREVPLDRKGA